MTMLQQINQDIADLTASAGNNPSDNDTIQALEILRDAMTLGLECYDDEIVGFSSELQVK